MAERYSYDIVGNRLTGPDARDSYEYAQGNMLIKDSVASYEYDTNGNLTKMQGVDWWVTYQYDYENRLTRVTDSNGMDVAYKYDPMGRRIEKNVLGQVTRYFYDAEDIAFEYSGNGTVGNIYVHGPGIDEPLGLRQSKGKYYYHADGLGSIIGITDASASLVQSYEYDSFGNLKDRKNRIKQPYAYTGREYDRETGLYYYRARYYMPEIGRFIQEDPIKFRSGDVNFYSYVLNRPIDFVDPWGLAIVVPTPAGPLPMPLPTTPGVEMPSNIDYSSLETLSKLAFTTIPMLIAQQCLSNEAEDEIERIQAEAQKTLDEANNMTQGNSGGDPGGGGPGPQTGFTVKLLIYRLLELYSELVGR